MRPEMNLAELQRKLIAAARVNAPSDHVPFAFEKRVMAHLKGVRMPDELGLWARALWRAAAPCVAIMLALTAWSFFGTTAAPASDLSQDLDNAVLAAVNQETVLDSTW